MKNNTVKFIEKKHPCINKEYLCIAHGNEAEEGSKHHNIKNIGEEELLRIEDELHEFDTKIM